MMRGTDEDEPGGLGRGASSMSGPSGAAPRRCRVAYYTVDVLTDGSEWTGEGTLFLSVHRQPPLQPPSRGFTAAPPRGAVTSTATAVDGGDDNDSVAAESARTPQHTSGLNNSAGDIDPMRPAAPLARYAFPALGDLTTRLAFDQRLSLAQTRAVFWGQATGGEGGSGDDDDDDSGAEAPRCRLRGLEGLPSLLINLKQAGAAQVTVVVGVDDDVVAVGGREGDTRNDRVDVASARDTTGIVQRVAALVARHTCTQMNLCSVPIVMGADDGAVKGEGGRGRDPETSANGGCWWMVYQDEYVVVHAKRVVAGSAAGDCSSSRSVGPRPRRRGQTTVIYLFTMLQHPEGTNASLVVVSGQVEPTVLEDAFRLLPLVNNQLEAAKIMWGLSVLSCLQSCPLDATTAPPYPNMKDISWFYTRPCDDGIVDSGLLVRAQQQSKAWHSYMPGNFPWNERSGSEQNPRQKHDDNRLRTGWSLVLRCPQNRQLMDRLEGMKHVPDSLTNRALWPLRYSFSASSNRDENEILLNEDENDVNAEPPLMQQKNCQYQPSTTASVELLALGTGCAVPSPYRGSSGYCLFLPDDFTFVFEAGEGFLTQWSRYSARSLSSIRIIWISHAHYDHYGGLASLLLKIYMLRRHRSAHIRQSSNKRQRTNCEYLPESSMPPVVLASDKILKYLNLIFQSPQLFFQGIDIGREGRRASDVVCRFQRDRSITSFPFRFFDTVRVNHSCVDSFGFILGLNRNRSEAEPFIFCFSGDTRPCERLVQVCRERAHQWNYGMIDLLMHEATFDNCEIQMSIAKKHSTIQEALKIGEAIRARKVLLTHFSQRYDAPPEQSISPAQGTPMFDGVLMQLIDD